MTGLIILLAALTAIVIFDLLAQTHGVDSRPDFDDPRARAKGLTT
jgi:hypothetical protein